MNERICTSINSLMYLKVGVSEKHMRMKNYFSVAKDPQFEVLS